MARESFSSSLVRLRMSRWRCTGRRRLKAAFMVMMGRLRTVACFSARWCGVAGTS